MNDKLDLERILIPMATVLREKGIPNVPFGTQGHTVYSYFANVFEDLVVNAIGCDNRGSEGFFLMYEDMANHSGGFGDFFQAFLKLQARTFPSIQGVSRLVPYFKQSGKPEGVNKPSIKPKEVVSNYLKRTGLIDIPRKQRVDALADPENWEKYSKIFAEEFIELIDKDNLQQFFFPLIGGNDFARLGDANVQGELVYGAYGKEGDDFEPPPFFENNMALLALYRRFAKGMDIKVNSHSIETKRPVAYVAKRKFDFGKDPLERLEYGLDSRGQLKPQIGKYPLEVRSRYQVSAGTFPEVRIGLLDCSGSTRLPVNTSPGKVMNPWADKEHQWKDNSIYHHELLCFFGLTELFRKRGTLKKSNIRSGVFSARTRMAKNLAESEQLVLEPDFGGTKFDTNSLDELFKGRGSLVYTISDGEITNWSTTKERFIRGAKEHNYFHLQIGKPSQMYKDLKDAGLRVCLDDGSNSAKILIDLTQKEIYGDSK